MHQRRTTLITIISALLITTLFFGCTSKKTAGQLMMDVTGESFPIVKTGTFNKNHDFWVFKMRDVARSGVQKSSLSLKNIRLENSTRAMGYTLIDPAGYEWDIISKVELEKGRTSSDSRKEAAVISYSFTGRMEERNTMVIRRIRADYTPADSDFDGSFRGEITNQKNEVLYTFESNARLDVHDKPDDGFQVFSIAIDEKTVAVLDSRNGYEVTFFEGLIPTQRTQLAGTISSLFMLMRYGIL